MFRVFLILIFIVGALSSSKLEIIKKRGFLRCGVNSNLPGFSQKDRDGIWRGLDVDFCRAVAATILRDSSKVKFIPLETNNRFKALKRGKIDILSRNTTQTESRDTTLGVDFIGVIYYDSEGFMVPKALSIKSIKELDGATICIKSNTTTELNLDDYFKSHQMQYKALKFKTNEELIQAFDDKKCDVISGDISGLHAQKSLLKEPEKLVILEEKISREPLSPAVKEGDFRWRDTVKWIREALLLAEAKDINSTTVDNIKTTTKDSEIKRLLGIEGTTCQNLHLDSDCFYRAIKQVGNYGEIFEKNIGKNSPLRIERGLNGLWKDGGLMYPLPFR